MMEDDENGDDGWKILKPGVVLFETTIGSLDKPIPHPILDDPSKMMRIIANPLYDKLTLSRAAQIQQSSSLNRPKERTTITPFKSPDITETLTTPLPNPSEISNSRPQSKSSSKRQISPQFLLPPPTASTRKSSRNIPSAAPTRAATTRPTTRAATARPTTYSIQSALINTTPNTKPTFVDGTIIDGTIRYVNSRHGFEVQRYSSHNWLSTDIFTKDACQSHEKTFREMLDKKRQYERLSRSIYSAEYYSKRWHELLKSYRQGYLTHTEWAAQNYQLLCLRTLYTNARKREQRDVDLDAQDVRRARAKTAYHQWKQNKTGDNLERQHSQVNTSAHSPHVTEGTSFLSNNSSSIPLLNTSDENSTTLVDTSLPMSTSMSGDNEAQQTSIHPPIIALKNISATEKALYMLDEQRWSLQAMLKRVVGLAEPLQPPPKIIHRKQSPRTNTSTDSGFESVA